jgi:hypothetical protein
MRAIAVETPYRVPTPEENARFKAEAEEYALRHPARFPKMVAAIRAREEEAFKVGFLTRGGA